MLIPPLPLIEHGRSHLDSSLVGELAWSRVLSIAAELPTALTTHYLECRLAAGDDRVDFLTCGTTSEHCPALLARELTPRWLESSRWRQMQSFFRAWNRGESEFCRFVPIAWLEFDVPRELPSIPLPQVGLCVYPPLACGAEAMAVPDPRDPRFLAACEHACAELRGSPLTPETRETLRRCLDALPEGGRALHLAPMTAREGDLLRFVPELPRATVLPYLDAIGWSGPRAPLQRVLELSRPRADMYKIDIDIDTKLSAKTAVASEFSSADPSQAVAFLDELVELDLCSQAKRDALRRWPGRDLVEIPGYGWPITLDRVLDFKIVIHPDARLEAKAYLGMSPSAQILHS